MAKYAYNAQYIENFEGNPLTISVDNPQKYDETVIDNAQRELIIDNIMSNVSEDIKARLTSVEGKYYHYFTSIPNHLLIYIPMDIFSNINVDNLHTITYNSSAYNTNISIKSDEQINMKFQKFLSILERNLAFIYENIEVINDNQVGIKDEGLVDTNLMLRKLNVPGYSRIVNLSNQLTDAEKELILKRIDDPSFDSFSYLDLIKIAKQKQLTTEEIDLIYSNINDYRLKLFDDMIKAKDNAKIEEYNKMIELLRQGNIDNDPTNIYSELINKEKTILEFANQVAKNEQTKKLEAKYFLNKSLYDIFIGLFLTIKDTIDFLTNNKLTYNSLLNFLQNKHRMIYIGIFIILIGIILNIIM